MGVSLISTFISYSLSTLLAFWFNNANGKHGYLSHIPVLHVVGFFCLVGLGLGLVLFFVLFGWGFLLFCFWFFLKKKLRKALLRCFLSKLNIPVAYRLWMFGLGWCQFCGKSVTE